MKNASPGLSKRMAASKNKNCPICGKNHADECWLKIDKNAPTFTKRQKEYLNVLGADVEGNKRNRKRKKKRKRQKYVSDESGSNSSDSDNLS